MNDQSSDRPVFHGPITYRQSAAVEEFCQLHWPDYCWQVYWIPGHPFHRWACRTCRKGPARVTLVTRNHGEAES